MNKIWKKRQKRKKDRNSFLEKIFIGFFPPFVQILTLIYGIYLLKESNFFETKDDLLEAKNIRLSTDSSILIQEIKSLNGLKLSLENKIGILDTTIQDLNEDLDSTNELYKAKQSESIILNNNVNYFKKSKILDYYQNYLFGVFTLESKEIDEIKSLINSDKILKEYLQNQIELELINNKYRDPQFGLKASALAIILNLNPKYQQYFESYLDKYLFYVKSNYNYYNEKFLAFLASNKWSNYQRHRNMEILVQSGSNFRKHFLMSQVAYYYSTLFHEGYNPSYNYYGLPKIFNFMVEKLSPLVTGPLIIENIEQIPFDEIYKNYMLAYFAICPQCYFSLESEVIAQNISELIKFEQIDSLTLTIKINNGYINAEIENSVFKTAIKVKSLLEEVDFQFSQNLYSRYYDFTNRFSIPKRSDFESMKDYKLAFEKFYSNNIYSLRPWSVQNIYNKIESPDVKRKIINSVFYDD